MPLLIFLLLFIVGATIAAFGALNTGKKMAQQKKEVEAFYDRAKKAKTVDELVLVSVDLIGYLVKPRDHDLISRVMEIQAYIKGRIEGIKPCQTK